MGECVPEARACGPCPAGTHNCDGVCAQNTSVNSCGTSACTPCRAPAGGTATCDGTRCDFTCTTGKKCGDLCVTGCCTTADCPAMAGKTATCDTAAHTCRYVCPAGTNDCNGTCIPVGACCRDADCPVQPGKVGTCDAATRRCEYGCPPMMRSCDGRCIANTGSCCADTDCPNGVACVSNACATGTCRMGFRMCNGTCTPIASIPAESCFNGADDDCDGMADCADSECQAVAMCVPDPGGEFRVVAQLGSAGAACPGSYQTKIQLSSLSAGSRECDTSGCTCTGQIACGQPPIFAQYCSRAQRDDEDFMEYQLFCVDECRSLRSPEVEIVRGAGGQNGCNYTEARSSHPVYVDEATGMRVGDPPVTSRSCARSGTATPPAPSIRQAAFCEPASSSRGGCASGNVCVPRPNLPVCAVASGSRTCPAGYANRETNWYQRYTGSRTCTACSCGSPSGGTCTGRVEIGYDGTCTDLNLTSGARSCLWLHHPAARYATPTSTPPTCTKGTSTIDRELTAEGQHTICCM